MFNIDIKDEKVNKYDISSDFIEGFASVKGLNNLMGFINLKGELVTDFKYGLVSSFSNGLAAVKDAETNLWGFVDITGKEVIPCKFEAVNNFTKEGLCSVCTKDMWKYINRSGNFVTDDLYYEASDYSEGYAIITDAAGKHLYIDVNGEILAFEFYDKCLPMKNGSAFAVDGNFIYKLNSMLKTEKAIFVEELGFDMSSSYFYRLNDNTLCLDDANHTIILNNDLECIHKGISIDYIENSDDPDFGVISLIGDNSYYTFTYSDGSYVECPDCFKCDEVDDCREGFITMYHRDKYGRIESFTVDKNWNIVFDINDSKRFLSYASEGLFVSSVNDKVGYENAKGEEVISHIYKSAGNFKNGFAVVDKIDGTQAVIDKEGNEVFVVPQITKTTINAGDKQVKLYSDNDLDLAFNKMEALSELEKQIKEEVISAFSEKSRAEQAKAVETAKKLGQMKLQ